MTDWFTTDKTFDELTRLTVNEYTDPTIYILRQVDDWYKENYGETTKFDKDKDGYIDGIYMIYDAIYRVMAVISAHTLKCMIGLKIFREFIC